MGESAQLRITPLLPHSTTPISNFLTTVSERLCVRMNIDRRRVWVRLPLKSDPNGVATRPKPRLK